MSALLDVQSREASLADNKFDHCSVELSVVTTALNEANNVEPFLSESVEALQALGIEWEILYIDDGSTDGTGDRVLEFASENCHENIRLIRHESCRGITAAIEESIIQSKGEFVCLLPADMECSPKADIPKLYQAMDENVDVVAGRRVGRGDGKSFASGVYNYLNRWLFDVYLHDANWIKLFRRDKAIGINMRSEWHRFFIPILASRGCKMKEVDVNWQPRKHGKSNFGLSRFPVSLADMLAVKLIISYGARPLLPFIYIAFFSLLVSLISLTVGLNIPEHSPRQWGLSLGLSATAMLVSVISFSIGACAELMLGMKGTRSR